MTSKKKEMEKIVKKLDILNKNKEKYSDLEFAEKQLKLFNILKHKYSRYLKLKEKMTLAFGIKTAKTLKTIAIQKEKVEKKRKK